MTTDELIEKTIGELSEAVFATHSSVWLGEGAAAILRAAFAEVRVHALQQAHLEVQAGNAETLGRIADLFPPRAAAGRPKP